MTSPSPPPLTEKPELTRSLQLFHSQLESLLPLRHFSEFHEDSKILDIARQVRTRLIQEFMPKTSSGLGLGFGLSCDQRITDLVKELLSQIKKLIDQHLQKNKEHRQETEEVLETVIDALCLMYRTDSEAELKMNTEMDEESKEAVFEMGKLDAIRRFEGRWQARCPEEFYDEQRKKLEMKLDVIQKEIGRKDGSMADGACVISESNLEKSGDSTAVKPIETGTDNVPSTSKDDDPKSNECEGLGKGSGVISKSNVSEQSGDSTAVKVKPSESDSDANQPENGNVKSDDLRKKTYECCHCDEGFFNKFLYECHLKTHVVKEIFTCPQCNRTFSTSERLRDHSRIHEQKYECGHCSMAFTDNFAFRRHLVTHSGERPYECSNCGEKFVRKEALVRHIVSKYNRTEEVAKNLANQAAVKYVKRETEEEDQLQDLDEFNMKTIDSHITDIVLKKAGLIPTTPGTKAGTRRTLRTSSSASASGSITQKKYRFDSDATSSKGNSKSEEAVVDEALQGGEGNNRLVIKVNLGVLPKKDQILEKVKGQQSSAPTCDGSGDILE